MDILVVIGQKLEEQEFDRVSSMFTHMTVIAETKFTSVVSLVQEKKYKLIVFMTFEDALPPSWKIDEIELDSPVMILLKVNKLDLYMFYSFLDSIGVASKPISDKSATSEIHPLIFKSLQFIEENIEENELSLEMVASSVFVSRCHYSRMFKENLGTGFKEYIMNKRIQKAKVMLSGGTPVTEVCYAVGYGDLTHFGRVFKRLVGVNPSVFRREKGKIGITAEGS